MSYALDEILTLKEVAQALRLDPRTVKEVAFALGGRRIGYRWRFRWGTVLEYFSNADVETRQRKLLGGESHRERQADSLQNVPGREKHGPEWRAAKEWEEEQKRLAREGMTIPTALELFMAWGDSYLTHVQRTMSRQTYVEKKLVTKDFFAYCGKKASMTSRKSLRQEPMSFFPESRMSAGRTLPTSTARICWLHGTGVPTSLRDFHRWHHLF
ncbi:hypothetical protein [Mailhella massiliensis]|uniref:hypothetical protein n=1 Tax=Mailhella massiliensis TaxID=1903261 RepID=UPI00097D8C47|nr:hypothetical protein [Mailhella massiliensis]